MSADDDRYGFRWGNVTVTRMTEVVRGRTTWRMLRVKTQRHRLDVYTTQGRGDIRVWLDGKELKGGDAS